MLSGIEVAFDLFFLLMDLLTTVLDCLLFRDHKKIERKKKRSSSITKKQ